MHQTTLRFGPDLWAAIEQECDSLGMSAAQFLREAAVARLAYNAGRRGDGDYHDAFSSTPSDAATALLESSDQNESAAALMGQSTVVLARARAIREHSIRMRKERGRMGVAR
jgi:hypothetical protein